MLTVSTYRTVFWLKVTSHLIVIAALHAAKLARLPEKQPALAWAQEGPKRAAPGRPLGLPSLYLFPSGPALWSYSY